MYNGGAVPFNLTGFFALVKIKRWECLLLTIGFYNEVRIRMHVMYSALDFHLFFPLHSKLDPRLSVCVRWKFILPV